MLVLKLKFGEPVVIEHGGEMLMVRPTYGEGGRISLSLDGPASFRLHRAELLDEKSRAWNRARRS